MDTFCAIVAAIFVGALAIGLTAAHIRISDLRDQVNHDRDISNKLRAIERELARKAAK